MVMHLPDGMREATTEDDIVIELWPVCGRRESWTRHLAQRMERGDVVECLEDLECDPAGASEQENITKVGVGRNGLVQTWRLSHTYGLNKSTMS